MALESVTYLNDLVVTNPTATDLRSQGDDHLRNIKIALATLLAAVPGANEGTPGTLTISAGGAVVPTASIHYVDTAGSASSDDLDTITATNFYTGGLLWIRALNTARSVVVKHGTGNITTIDGNDLTLDDTEKWTLLMYDGSGWLMLVGQIPDAFIATAKIQDDAITTAKIVDDAVTTAKIIDDAVTTAKILDANVTTAKLASGEQMTTTNVNSKIAATETGVVGSYAMLAHASAAVMAPGDNIAGSSLRYAGSLAASGTVPSGTWKCMGYDDGSGGATIFVRVS